MVIFFFNWVHFNAFLNDGKISTDQENKNKQPKINQNVCNKMLFILERGVG